MRHSTTVLALISASLFVGCPSSSEEKHEPPPAEKKTVATPKPADSGLAAPADVAAPPADSVKTPSGLASKVLRPGTGTEHPGPTSRVTVHYTGWTTDGKMFDSSVARGSPATFGLNQVIAGWTEGVQLMVVGEKRRFWIPQDLAYKGRPGPPAGMLVFDVELLGIAN
jgi:peptidylprolyl isomerase